ncbi:MAG TPA: acetate--CoA ligase family protein, partial [Nitrososphaerales archaeon]|nr:acetate--CoA ligase family protein [Nitrososphaerales archaeon]
HDHMRGMRSFFEPASIAVAGVSTDPDKLGSIIFDNLVVNSKKGILKASLYAQNPAYERIGDRPCYPSLDDLPETPELLIVAVPESLTPGLIKEAAESGVKAAVVIASGYAEVGRKGLEAEIGKVAEKHGMRILGPNTIGLLDTRSGVNSLFLRPTKTLPDGSQIVSLIRPLDGEITIVTQSGHLGETIAEELASNGVGIRALVGTGNQLDVSVEDVIQYFADDPGTKVVVVYLEGLRDGRRFLEVAANAASKKPLVVFKVGKTSVGARAALTHTASLVGSYEVYQAAFRKAGVIEANSLQELVDYSVALVTLPKPKGNRLAIVTNAGGVAAIAADEAARLGLRVDTLSKKAQRQLRAEFAGAAFTSNASVVNPFDLTASVTTDELAEFSKSVLVQPAYDLLLELPTHQAPAMGYDLGRRIGDAVSNAKKPVCMCVIGDSELAGRIRRDFMERGVPSFPTPERAARALGVVVAYEKVRRAIGGRPHLHKRHLLRFSQKRGQLSPDDVSRVLHSCRIGEPKSVVIHSPSEIQKLEMIGFPVACKLLSRGLVHKSDVGGVALDVAGVEEAKLVFARYRKLASRKGLKFDGMLVQEMVEGGIELILGGTRDLTFGPVLVLGFGGIHTELMREYLLALSPVTPSEVEAMLSQTKLGRILHGYRGGPAVEVGCLSKVVSRFSAVMVDNPPIDQMEVNPLIARGEEILSADARVVVGPGKTRVASLDV